MKRISELEVLEEISVADIRDKLNEVIQALNSLKCVEEERPVFEGLCDGECFLISMSEDGLLVACNKDGGVRLEMVKETEKTR